MAMLLRHAAGGHDVENHLIYGTFIAHFLAYIQK
jgi:hypothetical protein